MMMKTLTALALIAAASAAGAGQPYEPQMRAFLNDHLKKWIEDPAIVQAIEAQNARTASYSQAKIDELDKSWQAQIGEAEMPLVTPVIQNPAADFLRQQVKAAGGSILEAFVMDAKGLNVAASAPTSDYWQGDEAKWQMTFLKGPDAIDIGEVNFDESTQAYEAQISTTIVDPATGKPIGAITVGLNVDALQ